MSAIASALQGVKQRIALAAGVAGRDDRDIRLLAVSKTWPAEALREAWAAGQRAFGESYVQEALAKMQALADLPLEWHFIGPIQSNKARVIATHFAWVHSVERAGIAERLSQARPPGLPELNVCLQINVSGEASKHGVPPEQAAELARQVENLPRLRLRGLMAIPRATADVRLQRQQFRRLRELRDELTAAGFRLDTLSMGMSEDLEAAVAEGATLVRVGSAIFGAREKF